MTPRAEQQAATDAQSSTSLRPNDDASLRRWGGDLGKIAPALQEVDASHAKADAEFAHASAALARIAQQADSDQPASRRLAAELAALAQQAKELEAEAAALAARRKKLISQAETVPVTFRSEHERDLERADQPRNGWQAEKKADLTAMEQDS